MRLTYEDLKRLWTVIYSRSALLEADRWLDQMDNVSVEELRSALVCAIITAYGRPFTQSQVALGERVVPLRDVAPPKHLESTHRDLLNMRNKVIGHKDAIPAVGHTETPNELILRRDSRGFDLHTSITQDMDSDLRQRIKELCAHFVAHCDQQSDLLIRKYGDEFAQLKPGVYDIIVSDEPNDWIRPRRMNPVA
jgi:hypothetical protein